MSAKTTEFELLPKQTLVSSSCGAFVTTSTTFTPVTNLSVAAVNNNAVSEWNIYCQADGSGSASYFGGGGTPNQNQVWFAHIMRNGVEIAQYEYQTYVGLGGPYLALPSSAVRFTDINPPTGTNTYSIEVKTSSGQSLNVNNIVLVVQDLRQ